VFNKKTISQLFKNIFLPNLDWRDSSDDGLLSMGLREKRCSKMVENERKENMLRFLEKRKKQRGNGRLRIQRDCSGVSEYGSEYRSTAQSKGV
jgi:hypothetical protein